MAMDNIMDKRNNKVSPPFTWRANIKKDARKKEYQQTGTINLGTASYPKHPIQPPFMTDRIIHPPPQAGPPYPQPAPTFMPYQQTGLQSQYGKGPQPELIPHQYDPYPGQQPSAYDPATGRSSFYTTHPVQSTYSAIPPPIPFQGCGPAYYNPCPQYGPNTELPTIACRCPGVTPTPVPTSTLDERVTGCYQYWRLGKFGWHLLRCGILMTIVTRPERYEDQ